MPPKNRTVQKSICIQKEINCMNRNGAYNLSTIYDHILVTCSSSSASLATEKSHLGILFVFWLSYKNALSHGMYTNITAQ